MLRRISFFLGLNLGLLPASLLNAEDTLLAGFSFSQFLGSGIPTINADTFEPTDHIVATYRGNAVPDRNIVDGSIIVNTGGSGYDNSAIGDWSFANFDIFDGVAVTGESFGALNTVNSTTLAGLTKELHITDAAGMGLTFRTLNTLWNIQINTTAGYVNADTDDFTFAARGNDGAAVVEWLHNDTVFATTTIAPGAFAAYAHELPGGFYETGLIQGRLISGSVTFDNVQFNGTRGKPPVFTLQPVGRTVTAGSDVRFTSAVTGASNPKFRWYKNGAPLSDGDGISGVTTSNLSLSNVSLDTAGTYTVVVSNNGVTAESDPAILVVQTAPAFTRQPASTAANPGQTVVFDAVVTGFPTPSLRWEHNGSPLSDGPDISGTTTAELTLTNVTETSAGDYRLVVTNAVDNAVSSVATLTVTVDAVAPAIPVPPEPVVVITGGTATFQITATGAPAPSYQWRFKDEDLVDGDAISGATTRTLVLTNVSASQAGDYTVVVTNSAGTADATTSLSVLVPPSIPPDSQPVGQDIVSGESVTFAVSASGNPAPSFQWKKDGAPLPGETGPTLTIAKARPSHIGNYSVVATNSAGVIESNPAFLNVRTPPTIVTQPISQTVAGGAPFILTVVAKGSPEPTYQWLKNGNVIPHATDSSYALTTTTAADAGRYSVRVRNSAGTVVSQVATLAVTQAVAVTTPSSTQIFAPGSLLSLGQPVTSPGALTYQWLLNGKPIRGATSPLYVIPKAKGAHSGTYTLNVYNSAGRIVATRTMARIAITLANTYDTLLRDPDSDEPVGRLEIAVTATGAFTGRVLFEDGGSYPLKGRFKLNAAGNGGTAFEKITRTKGKALELDLTLDALAAEIEAGLSALGDSDPLGVGVATPRITHAEWQGTYTLTLKPAPTDSGETLKVDATIDPSGLLRLSGHTAGGRSFKVSVPGNTNGSYAIFIQPDAKSKARLAGSLVLTAGEESYGATFATSGFFYEVDPVSGIDLRFKPKLTP